MECFLREGLPGLGTSGFHWKKPLRTCLLFAQAAPFPHASAITCGMAIFLLSNEAQTDFTNENIITGGVWVALATCLFLISVFAEADARSRFQEFRRVRALLCRYGWNRRIIKAISHSRCQRDAIRLAAEEAGYPSEIGQFYQELGYRWFHLIPDLVLENPRNFFTRRFLRSSFFVKRFQEYRGEKTPPVLWQCADETP